MRTVLGRALGLVLLGALCRPVGADGYEMGRYRVEPGGKVRAARAADVDGDGRLDVVLLVEPREGKTWEIVLLRTTCRSRRCNTTVSTSWATSLLVPLPRPAPWPTMEPPPSPPPSAPGSPPL